MAVWASGRYYANGRGNVLELNRELQRLVERNGLFAEIQMDKITGKATLVVQGNRGYATSPVMQYKITQEQMARLMNGGWGGLGSADRKAYETFNSIIRKDFIPPESWVVAKNFGLNRFGENGFSYVNMGWGGIPMVKRPYGLYMAPERMDGRRPGESRAMRLLSNGSYVSTAGYVWRGNMQVHQAIINNEPKIEIKDIAPKAAPRPELLEWKASQLSDSPLYLTFAAQNDVLKNHGIIIRETKKNPDDEKTVKQLVIQAKDTRVDIRYTLTEEEYKELTKDDVKLEARLKTLNNIIKNDWKEPVTIDMLNKNGYVNLTYKEGKKEEYERAFIEYDQRQAAIKAEKEGIAQVQKEIAIERNRIASMSNAIDGRDISSVLKDRAFFFDNKGTHSRQITVGEIRADHDVDNSKYLEAMAQHNVVKDYGITQKILEDKDGNKDTLISIQQRVEKDYQQLKDKAIVTNTPLTLNEKETLTRLEKLNNEIKDVIDGKSNKITAVERPTLAAYPPEKDRYVLRAVVNGEWQEKELTKKEYNRFLEYDNAHRLKFFADKFDNIKIDKGYDNSYEIVKGRDGKIYRAEDINTQHAKAQYVNAQILSELAPEKGLFADQKGGREKQVGIIKVQEFKGVNIRQILEEQNTEESKALLKELNKKSGPKENIYVMTAWIKANGDKQYTEVKHFISQKEYNQFKTADDLQRIKMAGKIFNEFDVKTRQEYKVSAGQVLKSILNGIGAVALGGLTIAEDIEDMANGRPHGPHRHDSVLDKATRTAMAFDMIAQDVTQTVELTQDVTSHR